MTPALALFSVDPVGVDTNTGEDFNRHWYADDNACECADSKGSRVGSDAKRPRYWSYMTQLLRNLMRSPTVLNMWRTPDRSRATRQLVVAERREGDGRLHLRMVAVLLLACTVVSCGSSTGGKVNLEQIATKTRAISFYYTEYTDATFASNDEMKRSAMYSTWIDCWQVCERYTRGIIEHLAAAKPISCPSMFGVRYLLVEFSGGDFKVDVNYLKGGNIVVFGKKCYYNEQSIDEVIPSPEIWRSMMRDKNLLNAVQREVYRAEKKRAESPD